MKGIRIAGACLLAVLATGAVAASSAMANTLPEAGKCARVALGAGVYSSGTCTAHAKTGRGVYEWTPVSSTDKATFSGTGGETTLTTVGHPTIKCIDANLSGEWRNPKTATVEIEFQGCATPAEQQCQSGTAKSEIKTLPLEAELGFIKNELREGKLIVTVGLDLKPQPPLASLAMYECSGSAQTAHVEGSVIGKLGPINKMTTTMNLAYQATKLGQQKLQSFQEGPTDTLSTTFTEGLTTLGSGASSLNIKEELGTNAAPLEIKAIEK
jgi:uncharacterized cupredoxin-like copper-binding protein